MAHNRIAETTDVEELAACSTIGVLDISNNKLEDPAVVDVLAKMDNLHVLQMQGNPVTRKIQHYRKTVVARCQKLTYLDDRPVFEDERRTVTAWARGGAGHKVEPNADGSPGELSAVALYEALSDGTFDKNKAHEAEKEERKNIREEKEERERRMDFVPDESALAVETIEVDRDTMDMLKSLNMAQLPGVTLQTRSGNRFQGGPRKEGGGGNRN